MDGETRALPFVVLGTFVALVVGAVALSLSTAPVGAVDQLHQAAEATVQSSGFLLTDTNSVVSLATSGPGGGSGTTQVVHVRYQAPDAVEERGPDAAGQIVSVIAVGDRRFVSVGSRWRELPLGPDVGAQAAESLLFPLRAATQTDEVVRSGDRYGFVPVDLEHFVVTMFGPTEAPLGSFDVSATVHGDFVTGERISAVAGEERIEVDLALSRIGTAPPVAVPAGGLLTAPPG